MPDDQRRGGRCPGISTAEILAADVKPAPAFMGEGDVAAIPGAEYSIDAYLDPAFHRREVETMWSRCWQVACREDEVPNPGDFTVYDIADMSALVIRGRDGRLRAFVNSCPHRGTRLADGHGNSPRIRCGFHAMTWDCDGELKQLTCAWDFGDAAPGAFALTPVKLDRWGGFIFVNFEPGAGPLEDYLEGLPEHFARWPMEDRFTAAHVVKPLDCNWKVTIEAFIETFHVIGLHSESLPFFGDINSQYDVWSGKRHISRMINPSGVSSPHLGGKMTPERTLAAAVKFGLCQDGPLQAGETVRGRIVANLRGFYDSTFGVDLSHLSDSEVLDVIEYNLFPNLIVFGGFGSPLAYRSRPDGDDPNKSIFEVWLLLPYAGERPPPAPTRVLKPDENFGDVAELSYYGPVIDQDAVMMPRVQRGLRGNRNGKVTLGGYQEIRIRQLRQTLAEYMNQV
ncbi:MAG TPA: aromatic ring-hydroxylating dioxygenase subunit alpha [Alphaproteobacteria bacterium]|jgi:nitrite reductase/ring-hydroxylating ferredoxin subunit|nr:aromatic ring-hydroxylating dioxygenase subunit alpha [Alphaproteobacteria bacterium]